MNRVYFVGAGPGDPGLLTVKALFLLRRADVVLYDALVTPEILQLVSASAELTDVGKRCGQKSLTQDEINSLLIRHARHNHLTIRLKSGDPSIFGRLGEEIRALRQAGIEYEIVPGITSALAASAAAGISLTDRQFASSVVFATAHRCAGAEGMDWPRIASSQSTLVIYMPGRDYNGLTQHLIAAGLSADTPCAVIARAGGDDQITRTARLQNLPKLSGLPAPSTLIVGRCAQDVAPQVLDYAIQSQTQYQHEAICS